MNKYKVKINSILEKSNIHIIPSVQVTCKDDLISLKDIIDSIGWPILAKPSEDTAAMSAVEIVHNIHELKAYLDKYIGGNNPCYKDRSISKIILQKYISKNFQEFIIDFTSYQGIHYCNGIMLADKSIIDVDYRISRQYIPLVIDEIPTIKPVIEYVVCILNALKIVSGFTHNEVFWDKKDSFYLIESNNRIAGNGLNEVYQNVYGFSALTQLFNLLNEHNISRVPTERYKYSSVMDLYNLSTPNASRIDLEGIKSVQKILHFKNKNKQPDAFYKNYTRIDHINAAILLCNDTKELFKADIDVILEKEKSGTLFKS